MSSDCLFCKIVKGELNTKFLFEDEHVVAFKDISPKARVHVLVVPKKHISSLAHLDSNDQSLMGHLTLKLKDIALEQGLPDGFKIQVNTGRAAGQEVDHIHYHLLGA